MKTIKELEAEKTKFDVIQLDKNTIIYQAIKVELEALKDVIKLIDELFKETWPLINKKHCQIIWGEEIEELKARIEG